MDALEDREARLRQRLFGCTPPTLIRLSTSSHGGISKDVSTLHERVNQLCAGIAGFGKLEDLCRENEHHLALGRSAVSQANAAHADLVKRAVVVASEERIHRIVASLQHLQSLSSIVDQMQAMQSQTATQDSRLTHLDNEMLDLTQEALSTHTRVEALLKQYQQLVQVLSAKSAEYHALLEHLEQQ